MSSEACHMAALYGGKNTVLRPELLVGTARMPNRSLERLEQKGMAYSRYVPNGM